MFAFARHVLHDFEALFVMMNDGHVMNAITNMNYYGIVTCNAHIYCLRLQKVCLR